ncbi:MAG: tetratricopeptide repeat protein [Myxococcales bacterium]|nr:tetratricopeptide repeat protein [Myxococcales bacterium]
MRALLAVLRPERAQRRRRRWIVGGAVVGVAAASLALGASVAAPNVSCAPEAWQPAALLPDERLDALARAFAAQGGPYAAEAWPRVEQALVRYADRLAAGATAACNDTHVHGVQSSARLDQRMACLSRDRRELSARVAALAAIDEASLARSIPLATSLPDPDRCADLEQPIAEDHPALADRLAAARAVLIAGDAEAASAGAEALADEADARGPRWVAEQRELAGKALLAAHDTPGARARLEEGYLAARSAGDEARAARLSLALAGLRTTRTAEHDEALLWTRIAAGELARGGGEREAAVDLLLVEGNAYVGLGEVPAALTRYQAAEDALAAVGSPRPDHLAAVLSHRGVALELLGRFDEAVAAQERGLAIVRDALGAHHPLAIQQLTLIGTALAGAGRLAEAEARYREALALGEVIHGGDHPALAVTLADLAVLEGTRGRLAAAVALLERVLNIHEATPQPDPEEVAATLAMLGEYHSVAGDPRAGLALLDRALALERATHGDPHARVAECRMRRAQVLADAGDVAQALSEQLAAAADLERTLGPDSPLLADSLMLAGDNSRTLGDLTRSEALLRRSLEIWDRVDRDNPQAMHAATSLGALLVAAGRPAEAVPLLARAVELREAEVAAPWHLAESRYQLARALWAAGDERSRALTLAVQARDTLAEHPDPQAPDRRAEIDAWLAARRAR